MSWKIHRTGSHHPKCQWGIRPDHPKCWFGGGTTFSLQLVQHLFHPWTVQLPVLACWDRKQQEIIRNIFQFCALVQSNTFICYASTSLSCAGIQQWKSVSFHCWTAKNLVGELRRRRMTPPPPTHPTPKWSSRVGKMSNEEEEEDDPHPYPPTPKWSSRVGEMSNEEEGEDDPHPQMVIQSWWDEQWGGGGRWPPPPTHPPPNGHPELVRWAMRRRRKMTPTPTHPTPNGPHCEEFQMSDNICISCSPAVHTLYCSAGILRPRGFG